MKRTERRHLKDNELANLANRAQQVFEERSSQLTYLIAAVVVVLVGVIGYVAWNGSVQGRAGALLAEAITIEEARVGAPPAPGSPAAGLSYPTEREKNQAALTKFKIVADQYPSTDAGLFARYRQATTFMALGEAKSAADTYQQVIDRAGDNIYGQMARLGQAQAQALSGQLDAAINTFKDLSTRKDGPLPVDGILMALGKAYVDAGKASDAQQTFNRLVDEFPESPFTSDARRELDTLKKT
jgi:outer membrane protein assembly factor BamD (BamD/ComL family)